MNELLLIFYSLDRPVVSQYSQEENSSSAPLVEDGGPPPVSEKRITPPKSHLQSKATSLTGKRAVEAQPVASQVGGGHQCSKKRAIAAASIEPAATPVRNNEAVSDITAKQPPTKPPPRNPYAKGNLPAPAKKTQREVDEDILDLYSEALAKKKNMCPRCFALSTTSTCTGGRNCQFNERQCYECENSGCQKKNCGINGHPRDPLCCSCWRPVEMHGSSDKRSVGYKCKITGSVIRFPWSFVMILYQKKKHDLQSLVGKVSKSGHKAAHVCASITNFSRWLFETPHGHVAVTNLHLLMLEYMDISWNS